MSYIDYFFSSISASAYLASNRFEEIVQKHKATVVYKPFDAFSLFALTGGTPPAQGHPLRQDYRLQELQRQSKNKAPPITIKPQFFQTNVVPASYAIIAAHAGGSGNVTALVQGLLRACWSEEKDMVQEYVIKECLFQSGFDGEITDRELLKGAETYLVNLENAVTDGVFGSLFYFVNKGFRFWGHDKLYDFDTHLSGEL